MHSVSFQPRCEVLEVDANMYKSRCEWFRKIQDSLRTVLARAPGPLRVERAGKRFSTQGCCRRTSQFWVRSDGRNCRSGRRLGAAAKKPRNRKDRPEAVGCIQIRTRDQNRNPGLFLFIFSVLNRGHASNPHPQGRDAVEHSEERGVIETLYPWEVQ